MKKTIFKTIMLLSALFSVLSVNASTTENRQHKIAKYFDVLHYMFRDLDAYYVDSVDVDKVFEASIGGMLSVFDPYTSYIPEEEVSDFKYMTTGEYAGIGAIITQRDGKIYISEPYENMPAQKAGLLFGDEILSVDGEDVRGKDVSYVSDKLRGRPNSEIVLEVRREGVKKPIKFAFTRQQIVVPQVVYYGMVAEKVGYIYLESFTDKATQEVKQALLDLKKQGATSLVLDLRENGGGLMSEAVSICNLFVDKGEEIVSTRGKAKSDNRHYKTRSEAVDTQMSLVVLISGGSASSSEIVAGALQDLDRAVIVGERSYGKGLVQATREMPASGLLKMTTAKYYIPSGRCIQAVDYTHRDENGAVSRIPDSLTTVFHTRHGREVRDGGGIRPDVELSEETLSNLSVKLAVNHFYFDFANDYFRQHPSIASPSTFRITDEDYQAFTQFVLNKGVDYDLQSRKLMDRFKSMLQQEGLYDEVKAEFEALDAKLNSDLAAHLHLFREDITRFIESSIVLRYYYQKGEHEYMLRDDSFLEKAIELLQNNEKYFSILNVDNQIDKQK